LSIARSRLTAHALMTMGARIHKLRGSKRVTLRKLGQQTGLSPSMLSLVERGKATPSIGSLIVICAALDVHLTDLLADSSSVPRGPISRAAKQPMLEMAKGVLHKVIRDDKVRGIEISLDEYKPRTGNAPSAVHHVGYEYGIVLEGELTVTLDGVQHRLMAGDLISYDSALPHRIWNEGREPVRTIWITLNRSGTGK
jgi:transcriptional regulator with XRE-family HTH domain